MHMKAALLTGLILLTPFAASAEDRPVGITRDLMSFEMTHEGKKYEIQRNQDNFNEINPKFALTSRPCPPFCIQPMTIAPGVETLGELEIMDYMQRKEAGDESILIIDSRTPDWVASGTIPGSVNIPWNTLHQGSGATVMDIGLVLEDKFGAQDLGGLWDFSQAKTLVLFCNGPWCGQSPTNIRTLLQVGYPAEKLKWYRGGMQAWEVFGLKHTKSHEMF